MTVQKEITLRVNANLFFVNELNCLCAVAQGQTGKQYYFVSNAQPTHLITGYSWIVYPPGYPGESGEVLEPSEHSGQSTENDPEYFLTEGYYTIDLQLTDGCGLSGSASLQFFVNLYESTYSVYPNPSSGQFTVKVNESASASLGQSIGSATQARGNNFVTIQIRTLSGTVLKQMAVNLQNEASIDASDLAEGLYVLSILKNGQAVESKNIVIKK